VTHGGCPDGHTSAFLLHKYLPPTREPREFHAAYDRVNPPEGIAPGDKVIIADYSYPRDTLVELAMHCSVELLDHHKTAEADLVGLDIPNLNITFDMNKSGAMLVWEYVGSPPEAYDLVSYIQDYDLWTKELPNTEEINAVIQSMEMTFENWDDLESRLDFTDEIVHVISEGKAIRRYQRKIIDAAKRDARKMTIGGHEVLVTQSPYALGSMIAGEMAEENPDMAFGAYYIDSTEGRQFGLRSRSDSDDPGFDVSEVAQQYDGGGHHNASGFKVDWNHELSGRG